MALKNREITAAGKIRNQCRAGRWAKPTSGLAPGFAQANMVILDRRLAFDFSSSASGIPNPARSWRYWSRVKKNRSGPHPGPISPPTCLCTGFGKKGNWIRK